MQANVGGIDRVLRILVELGLGLWVLLFSGPTWAWLGLAVMASGIIRFCGAYRIFGFSTCKAQAKTEN